MGILSDRDIAESLMTGYLGISDYNERGLTPNGYDLRIAEIAVRGQPETIREGVARIPPRTMFYVSTIERVRLPRDVCAQLWMRTTWIRKGCIGAFGKIDAGFEGTLTLGAYNATDDTVEIPIGERFCQAVFETLNSETVKAYAERSGHYQGQTGITLDPLKKDRWKKSSGRTGFADAPGRILPIRLTSDTTTRSGACPPMTTASCTRC